MKPHPALVRTVVAACLFASAGCPPAPLDKNIELGPVATGAGSLTAARRYLEGRWTLESFEMYLPGKAPIALKGAGTLVYDEFGNLRMEIRADQASSDLLRAAGIDIRDGVISTDGRTVVDMQNRTLTYVIKDQSPLIPGPLATTRPRHWEVTDNILTLTTKDDAGAPLSVGKWRKSN
jgi:hypothetical protein